MWLGWIRLTIVDDAHGIGVLAENGKGVLEYLDLEEEIYIQIGTLSKVFGGEG